jgi:hypothetical protein
MPKQPRILRPAHSEPNGFWLGYILLPYGDYYAPSQDIVKAQKGDILRFYNGNDYTIERVIKIPQDEMCDMLCRLRYGIPWKIAFKKWESNAVLEGNSRSVLSKDYCLWVIYDTDTY